MSTMVLTRRTQTKTPLIRWSERYSVCIRELDKHHRMMLLMLNEMNETLESSVWTDDQTRLLEGLLNFTIEHFSTEEDLFDMYSYPWAATHKADHAAFLQVISAFYQGVKEGRHQISRNFLETCCNWLKNHIVARDKTYSYYFLGKGLA